MAHHLYQRDGVWYFRGAGKRISLKTKSKRQAMAMRDELVKQIILTGSFERARMLSIPTFEEFSKVFLKQKKKVVRQRTYKEYKRLLERDLVPFFGRYQLDVVKPILIHEYINTQTCSNRTLNGKLDMLNNVMKLAMSFEYITANPVKAIQRAKNEANELVAFTLEDVYKFLDNVSKHYKPWFVVAFFTGMRPEEINGLRRKCVDFDRNVIKIQEVYTEDKRFDEPKTKSSKREIPMLPIVRTTLLHLCMTKQPDELVFLSKQGNPVSRGNLSEWVWRPTLRKLGMPMQRMYVTRHTFCTLMCSAGEKPGTVARLMGHSSLDYVNKIYYRFQSLEDKDVFRKFQRMDTEATQAKSVADADKQEVEQIQDLTLFVGGT